MSAKVSKAKYIKELCDRHPYITQGLVSGVLQVVSDVIAQKQIEKKENLDVKRCFNFLVVGYLTGLLLRSWYGFLEVKIMNPKRLNNALSKVCGEIIFCSTHELKFYNVISSVDQLIFAPTFLGISTGFVGFLQTRDTNGIKEILKREYTDIMISNYKFWPAVQFVNFYFMPLNYQVGLNSILAVAWSTYFSYKTYSSFQDRIEIQTGYEKAENLNLSAFDSPKIQQKSSFLKK